jgi:hypothetical protein
MGENMTLPHILDLGCSAHSSTVPVAVMAWAVSRPKTPSP